MPPATGRSMKESGGGGGGGGGACGEQTQAQWPESSGPKMSQQT